MRTLVSLLPLLFVSGCRPTYACAVDAHCREGEVCITFKLAPGDEGSGCHPLCKPECPQGLTCTGCPESSQRCTRVDGTPSGGYCLAPGEQPYPLP